MVNRQLERYRQLNDFGLVLFSSSLLFCIHPFFPLAFSFTCRFFSFKRNKEKREVKRGRMKGGHMGGEILRVWSLREVSRCVWYTKLS